MFSSGNLLSVASRLPSVAIGPDTPPVFGFVLSRIISCSPVSVEGLVSPHSLPAIWAAGHATAGNTLALWGFTGSLPFAIRLKAARWMAQPSVTPGVPQWPPASCFLDLLIKCFKRSAQAGNSKARASAQASAQAFYRAKRGLENYLQQARKHLLTTHGVWETR